eukprot:sb/3462591/
MERYGIDDNDTIENLEQKANVSFSIFRHTGYLLYESREYREKHVTMIKAPSGLYYFIPKRMLGAFGSQWAHRYKWNDRKYHNNIKMQREAAMKTPQLEVDLSATPYSQPRAVSIPLQPRDQQGEKPGEEEMITRNTKLHSLVVRGPPDLYPRYVRGKGGYKARTPHVKKRFNQPAEEGDGGTAEQGDDESTMKHETETTGMDALWSPKLLTLDTEYDIAALPLGGKMEQTVRLITVGSKGANSLGGSKVTMISTNKVLAKGEILLTTKDHIIFIIPRTKNNKKVASLDSSQGSEGSNQEDSLSDNHPVTASGESNSSSQESTESSITSQPECPVTSQPECSIQSQPESQPVQSESMIPLTQQTIPQKSFTQLLRESTEVLEQEWTTQPSIPESSTTQCSASQHDCAIPPPEYSALHPDCSIPPPDQCSTTQPPSSTAQSQSSTTQPDCSAALPESSLPPPESSFPQLESSFPQLEKEEHEVQLHVIYPSHKRAHEELEFAASKSPWFKTGTKPKPKPFAIKTGKEDSVITVLSDSDDDDKPTDPPPPSSSQVQQQPQPSQVTPVPPTQVIVLADDTEEDGPPTGQKKVTLEQQIEIVARESNKQRPPPPHRPMLANRSSRQSLPYKPFKPLVRGPSKGYKVGIPQVQLIPSIVPWPREGPSSRSGRGMMPIAMPVSSSVSIAPLKQSTKTSKKQQISSTSATV